jgi:hypothetical protein
MIRLGALLFGSLLLAPAPALAQTVLGTVVEEDTGSPVVGARAEMVGADATMVARTETDQFGRFLLRVPRSGTFTLRLTHPFFTTVESAGVSVGPDETIEVSMRMARGAIPLDPIIVTARRTGRLAGFHQRREQTGFGRFMVRSEIQRRPAARTTDLLRDMPEIRIIRRGMEDNQITMRLGQCVPSIFIDGMPVRQGPGSGLDRLLRPDALEGIEVYSGSAGVPAQFVVSDGCGVVAFWTRSGQDEEGEPWSWRRLITAAAVLGAMGAIVGLTR